MHRRTLIQWTLSLAAAWPWRIPLLAQRAGLSTTQETTLRELATIVLPSPLGRAKTDEIVDGFLRWMRGYKPGAELEHGYGFPRVRVAAASPVPRYAQQLDSLQAAAHGRRLVHMDPDEQATLVSSVLSDAKITELPGRPAGQHVIADLMSFYFESSEASDFCYAAEIGRDACRSLEDSSRAPRARTSTSEGRS